MSNVEAFTWTVMDLVTRMERGQLSVPAEAQPQHLDPDRLPSLLDAMRHGWTGPITLTYLPQRGYIVIDGVTRLTLWQYTLTDPTGDATRPDWTRALGISGLTDGTGPRFTFTDDHGRREVAVWQLTRTMPFLSWQHRVRTSGATDADQLINHAERLAARLAHCPVPVIVMPPDTDQRRVRDQANARIAMR